MADCRGSLMPMQTKESPDVQVTSMCTVVECTIPRGGSAGPPTHPVVHT